MTAPAGRPALVALDRAGVAVARVYPEGDSVQLPPFVARGMAVEGWQLVLVAEAQQSPEAARLLGATSVTVDAATARIVRA